MRIASAWVLGLLALALGVTAAFADTPQYIKEPDKYASDIMSLLSGNDVAAASKTLSATIGKPASEENLEKALSMLSDKKIDYSDKVIDNTFGKSLRQIVYYCFVENIGFFYFRFNFKMSSHGWILANFTFKTESNELFPRDFISP